jgi:hypothetical protein
MADGKPRFSPETDWKIWKGTFSFGLPFLALSLPRLRREAWGWKMFVDINGALHATGSNMVKREFEVRLRLDLSQLNATLRAIIRRWATWTIIPVVTVNYACPVTS